MTVESILAFLFKNMHLFVCGAQDWTRDQTRSPYTGIAVSATEPSRGAHTLSFLRKVM